MSYTKKISEMKKQYSIELNYSKNEKIFYFYIEDDFIGINFSLEKRLHFSQEIDVITDLFDILDLDQNGSMIKCYNFVHSLGKIKGKKSDKELIQAFIERVQKSKNIEEHFKNYTDNFNNEHIDRCSSSFRDIKYIMRCSKFILSTSNSGDSSLNFQGIIANEEIHEEVHIHYDKLNFLKSRVMKTLYDIEFEEILIIFGNFSLSFINSSLKNNSLNFLSISKSNSSSLSFNKFLIFVNNSHAVPLSARKM